METNIGSPHKIYILADPNTKLYRYIGYTSREEERYNEHHALARLKDITHKNNWIKSLIKKGQKAEMIIIAEYETAEELPAAEEYWYAFFISNGADLTNNPNFIGSAAALAGIPRTPEVKAKISKSHKGKKLTEEHRQKLSDAHKGEKFTEEHKQNLSKALKGINTGPKTEEHKRKLSESHKGKKRGPHSEDRKRNISNSNKGKPSPNKGKKFSEEHKQKMSIAKKGKTWKLIDGKRVWSEKKTN